MEPNYRRTDNPESSSQPQSSNSRPPNHYRGPHNNSYRPNHRPNPNHRNQNPQGEVIIKNEESEINLNEKSQPEQHYKPKPNKFKKPYKDAVPEENKNEEQSGMIQDMNSPSPSSKPKPSQKKKYCHFYQTGKCKNDCAYLHTSTPLGVCLSLDFCVPCEISIAFCSHDHNPKDCKKQPVGTPALQDLITNTYLALKEQRDQTLTYKRELHDLLDSDSEAKDLVIFKIKQLIKQREIFCDTMNFKIKKALEKQKNMEISPSSIKDMMCELSMFKRGLPAYSIKREILFELKQQHSFCIVLGETGSGKTTQVPQFLYQSYLYSPYKVICVQPRKVAAISLAKRVAEELGVKVGEEVGYQVGFGKPSANEGSDKNAYSECEYGNKTKLLFVTESILLKKLTADCKKGKTTRFFADTRAILLDEIHERSLLSDLIFGMMKDQNFLSRYPEMKIFLASATVDVEKFKSYFNGCKALQIPGRTFPIDIKYRPLFEENYIEGTIECMKEIVAQTKKRNTNYQGHIIVFLTSVDEMEDVKDELIKTFGESFQEKHEILFLHGRLTNEEQQKVFQPSEKTKIILATKVAESSITIDGVKIVIDSGFDKDACYDSQKGITILETELISQASARQRAGRAGRTGPGICYRLYSEETFQKLEIGKKPEIAKVNLDIALLRIKDFGADPVTFKYFEPPEPLTIKSTLKGLVAIGALDETDGTLTVQGKVMMEMSTEPKKTKAIIQACERGCQDKVIKALAVESFSRSLFFLPSDVKERREFLSRRVGDDSGYQSDYLDYLYIYEKYEEAFKSKSWGWINTNKVNTKTLNKCYTLVGQIQKEIYHLKKKKVEFEQLLSPNKSLISSNVKENILKCFMSSCVMELAKYSGFKKLGYVNIMDGFMFHIHNSSSQKDFFPETNNINSSFAIYSQMDNFNGKNLAKSVSIVPSVWMNDTTIISETMGRTLLEYIKQNYRYTQREFNMPSWAIRRFRLNFKDRINEWTNRIEKTYQNVVRVIPAGNFSISFVSTKEGDYIDQFFEGLKRELDVEVVKESLIYNLDDTNYTPIIKDGLGVSDLLLPDDFITVSYSKLFGAKTKEEVMSALTLNQNDVCYVTINHQGGYASGDIKFINKDKARLFVEKNQQKINQKLLELQPALQKIKKKAFVESCQIRVTFTLAESQCLAKVSFENDHDCEFAMAAIQANPMIDGARVTVERNKKKSEEFFIKNLNPITDEVILKNRVIGQLSLPKIVVHRKPLNQDAKTISDEDRFIFNSLFTKYLSREEIENMYFTFKAPKNYEHLTRVFISLSSRTVAEKFISEYDGQVGIFGTQRLRIKIENSTTLRANKHVFNVMNWVIQKRKEEILAEGHADLAINIDDLEGKEKEKVQHFNKIKITSKDQALNRRIANEFTRILQGEKFTANSDQDTMKLFTTDMIKVYQSVQDSFVGAGKHLYIAYDVHTKKVTLHSPFPHVIEEAKQMLQNALETKVKFEQIDVSGYDIKKVQNYIQKQNQQDELININLNYIRKVVFIRANKTAIEQFKQQIEKFKRVKASAESDCPLCFDPLNDNAVLLYNCGHKFCKECFENYVKYQGERLQVTCPLPDCGKVIAFKDLVENVSLSVKNEVIEQHILLYMRANSQSYKNCPTPDCNYIYPADKPSYDCISCGESYCLKNPQKPHKNHPGETCQEFIDRNDVEKQFELMTKRGEVKITQCCKVPMMKNGGCNHITCHCGKHFCWTCLAVFDTGNETYIHMGRCGG